MHPKQPDPYTDIRHAVDFVERAPLLPIAARCLAEGDSLDDLVRAIREAAEEVLAQEDLTRPYVVRAVREQVQRPEFRTWLAGRLGLV